MYISCSLNQKLVQATEDCPEKQKSLKYLDKIQKNRRDWARNLTGQLDSEISEEELVELMKQFYRSYDLRMSIAGDKREILENNNEEDA